MSAFQRGTEGGQRPTSDSQRLRWQSVALTAVDGEGRKLPPRIRSDAYVEEDPRPGVRVCEADEQARVRFISSRAWIAREWSRWARFWASRETGGSDER